MDLRNGPEIIVNRHRRGCPFSGRKPDHTVSTRGSLFGAGRFTPQVARAEAEAANPAKVNGSPPMRFPGKHQIHDPHIGWGLCGSSLITSTV
jgi:hypothetical protein